MIELSYSKFRNMETGKSSTQNYSNNQPERSLEVCEACQARIGRIVMNYEANMIRIYWKRNEDFIQNKWNPFKIFRAYKKSVTEVIELSKKIKNELEEEKRRKEELKKIYRF